MEIRVQCDLCEYTWLADRSWVNRQADCPLCQTKIVVREERDEPASQKSGPSFFARVRSISAQVATAVSVIGLLGIMISLLWIDPRSSLAEQRRTIATAASPPIPEIKPSTPDRSQETAEPSRPKPAFEPTVRRPGEGTVSKSLPQVAADGEKFEAEKFEAEKSDVTFAENPFRPARDRGSDANAEDSDPPKNPFRKSAPADDTAATASTSSDEPDGENGTDDGTVDRTAQRPFRPSSGPLPSAGAKGKTVRNPPAASTRVTSLERLKRGDRILIFWGSMWYPGRVRAVGRAEIHIHYDGWSETWDEWVMPSEVRLLP